MIDETKIMQYADGTLPQEEHEEVKKAIEADPKLKELYSSYQETGDLLFKLGKEIKSQPLPSSLQEKLKTINEEKSKDTKKPFIFFRIPKIAYAGIAVVFAFILYNVFQTSVPLVVNEISDGSILRTGAVLKKFEITENVSDSGDGMLNTKDLKNFYGDYLKLYNIEKIIDEKKSKNKFTNKIKEFTRTALYGNNAKTIFAKWKDSVVWITNPNASIEDDKIVAGGGIGSGSLIDNNGLILTNWHVIQNANQVWVYPFPKDPAKGLQMHKVVDAEKFLARVVAKDKKRDLALVQITGLSKRIRPITLGTNDKVVTGEKVFSIGHPAFYGWSITDGIVNQIRVNDTWTFGKELKKDEKPDHEATLVQHSAGITGGNSGGPLFNEKGNMIAINNMGYPGEVILNFAIVVKHAQELIQNKEEPGIKTTSIVEPLTEKILEQKYPNLKSEDWSKNGIIDTWYVDANNNGNGDTVYIDDDEDGFIEEIVMDLNENGSIEIKLLDNDLDGSFEVKLIDRDDDDKLEPKWEAVAIDIDQDGAWDKVQDFPKS